MHGEQAHGLAAVYARRFEVRLHALVFERAQKLPSAAKAPPLKIERGLQQRPQIA